MKKKAPSTGQIKRTSPYRYGFGMFGTSIPINMFKSYAAAYYVIQLGLITTAQFSKILFIYTFVDAIDNPVYGFLSDNTRTKWGRRRPWLVIGVPLLILSFIAFFNVPGFILADPSENHRMVYIYMLLMYILTGTLDSLMNANYGALFPELFKGDAERAKTNAFRQGCQLVAMVISIALTPMITSKIGYQLTAVIYGVVALAVIMFMTFGCHEDPSSWSTEKPHLLDSIKALVTNKNFWIFGLTGAFYSAAFSLISQAVPFYVAYALKLNSSTTTYLLAAVFAVALIGVVIWTQIVKKVSVMKAWRNSFLIMAIGVVPLWFANSLAAAIPIAGIVGFGVAGCLTTMDCVGAKFMDDDYKKYGIKREAIISSFMGVMNRMNGLFTALAFYVMYKGFGFEDGENPGPRPDIASKMLLIVFPGVAVLISAIIARFLHFSDEEKKKSKAAVFASELIAKALHHGDKKKNEENE